MKKLITLFSALLLSVSAFAAQYEEGKNYTVLNTEKSATPTVTEYFSFYCPHCYQFENIVKNLKPALPDDVSFKKVHVSFMGGNMAIPMAKSYATMVSLGIEDQMIPVMFRQIHDLRQPPRDEAQLRQLFTDNGVDSKKFDAAYNGFAVDSMQKRFDKQFQSTSLTGVPGVVVNNKYVVKTEGIRSFEDYNKLVNYLLTL